MLTEAERFSRAAGVKTLKLPLEEGGGPLVAKPGTPLGKHVASIPALLTGAHISPTSHSTTGAWLLYMQL